MNTPFFADGIKNIFINNGIVHFELVSVVFNEKNEPVPSSSGMLAISLNGFLNLHDQMNSIIKKMLNEGVLKPNEIEDSKKKK